MGHAVSWDVNYSLAEVSTGAVENVRRETFIIDSDTKIERNSHRHFGTRVFCGFAEIGIDKTGQFWYRYLKRVGKLGDG
jgi:hypothetical protein